MKIETPLRVSEIDDCLIFGPEEASSLGLIRVFRSTQDALDIVRAVNAHSDLLLACKEAALLIAETARSIGADPLKGTCLPRLLAAIKLAEA